MSLPGTDSRRCEFVVNNCSFCSFRSANGVEFVKHLFEAHSYEANFWYECGISSCTRVFTTGTSFDAFRGHCARKHHNWQVDFTPTSEPAGEEEDSYVLSGCTADREVSETDHMIDTEDDVESTDNMDTSANDLDMSDHLSNTVAHGAEQPVSNMQSANVKTAVAKFILTLKEKFKLTQTSLNYTVKAVEELLLLSNKSLEQSIADNLGLTDSPLGLHSSPFDDLRTEHQQTKFFRENFGLIVSDVYVCNGT